MKPVSPSSDVTTFALDDASWGLSGVLTTPEFLDADTFCSTPPLDLLRSAAARDPAAVALAGLTVALSYADVLRLAQNAARAVAERVPPGAAVACLASRRPDHIAALLGCLIAGRPCLVIDANDPIERRDALLAEAAPSLVLAVEPSSFPCPVLTFADALAGPDQTWRPDHVWDPDAPFAIHFTSGSTGRPKGIVLAARSVLYRALWTAETFAMTPDSRMLQPNVPIASTGLSTLLGVLSRGARMVLMDLANEGAGAALNLIEREAVTCASITPSIVRMMSGLRRSKPAFRTLRMLRLGADALPRADLAAWRLMLPPDCAIVYAYASSEALVMSQWVVPPEDVREELRVPAGILHLCHDYAVLGETGQPVAPGEAGELVLRSRYVASGEWQAGRLVPGRMPADPNRPGWRLFRTGDVVRVHPDGMLRVLGRVDRQVKVNGVLVQPAEIEAVLKSEPRVSDAAVVARTSPSGTVLHGYVVTEEADHAALIAALRRRLAANLPAVFRPPRLSVLDRLPLLPGGKIDLVALAKPPVEL
jgi:non-ribosomal peptide synthetase component F